MLFVTGLMHRVCVAQSGGSGLEELAQCLIGQNHLVVDSPHDSITMASPDMLCILLWLFLLCVTALLSWCLVPRLWCLMSAFDVCSVASRGLPVLDTVFCLSFNAAYQSITRKHSECSPFLPLSLCPPLRPVLYHH